MIEKKSGNTLRIAVLLTCFNRRESTLQCLQRLFAGTTAKGVSLCAYLVDDGSTDNTAQAVADSFDKVKIEVSTENLFWCRGMHRAFSMASADNPDYYLWLNDDSILMDDALERLIATAEKVAADNAGKSIVVGSTVDAITGVLTYGGCRRLGGARKMRFNRVTPSDQAQRCDTMNGNIVLISKAAAFEVGNLDPVFEHAMGDIDYGLRANRLGIPVWLAPGIYGTCSNNPVANTYMDTRLPLRRRWQLMMHRKGLPWRSWLALTRRHAGPSWPVFFLWPYASLVINSLTGKGGRS